MRLTPCGLMCDFFSTSLVIVNCEQEVPHIGHDCDPHACKGTELVR